LNNRAAGACKEQHNRPRISLGEQIMGFSQVVLQGKIGDFRTVFRSHELMRAQGQNEK